ncbi:hypothetical protein QJS04_geneDACA001900 [Acorus gramineus]|uniref:Dirigent protein n=1 Tax=Acorus gramineus TaxID=55184 RepID=A0AAV9BJN7_ACOGR|nr:hypothetical protein QJS04_geneDACA001900 [Acorus gramineus]
MIISSSIFFTTTFSLPDEKLTQMTFYYQETNAAREPRDLTGIAAVPPVNWTTTNFGMVEVMDDPMTERADPSSKQLGRIQGMYVYASKEEYSVLMVMNLVFMEGSGTTYNGSTLSLVGKNSLLAEEREMSVVGGSGVFRLARGFVTLRTIVFDRKTNNVIIQYNMTVLHY